MEYTVIEFGAGCSIDTAVEELKICEGKYCGSFNGIMLYSDIDDLDSAYKKITGKTKSEYDSLLKKQNDEYEKEKRRHKESIPELTKEWIEKGNAILDEKYRELWAKCVPIRLDDLYRGMELICCLDIVKELNKGCSLNEAKNIIDKQSHSGTSFYLVCSMVKSFCGRGKEFVDFVRN